MLSLQAWGEECLRLRHHLMANKADRNTISSAKQWFLATQILPILLYYAEVSESPTKFPATISFNIRKGVPKWVHHILWLRGWYLMMTVLQKQGPLIKGFSVQMVLTGAVTIMCCPLGQGRTSDQIHFIGAGLYMIDHHLMCQMFEVATAYRASFYGSLLGLFGSIIRRKQIEDEHGIPAEGTANVEKLQAKVQKLPTATRSLLWWYDLAVMAFENALFIAFVTGMDSGL